VPAHDAGTIAHTKAQNKACDTYGQSDESECREGEKIEKSLFIFAPARQIFGAVREILIFHYSLLKISHRHDGKFIHPRHHDDEYSDTRDTKAHNCALFLRSKPQQKARDEKHQNH